MLPTLSNGLPVIVRTDTTLENLDCICGVNCCPGGNAYEMLDYFYPLLGDRENLDRIAEGGRNLYLDKFHPLVACKTLPRHTAPAAAVC